MGLRGAEPPVKRSSLRPRGNLFKNFPLLKNNNSRSSRRNTPKISLKTKNFPEKEKCPPPRAGAHEEDSAPLILS